MAKTLSKLNRTNQEQLIAEKNKVTEKVKRVVQKKKIEPIKRKTNKPVSYTHLTLPTI